MKTAKEQKIAKFEEIVADNTRPSSATNPPNTYSNLAKDGEVPHSITLIAIDTINTPFLDQAYGRKELIKYLSGNLQPSGPIGLVIIGSKGMRVLSYLTKDPASLIVALKKVAGETPAMQGISQDSQAELLEGELRSFVMLGEDPVTVAYQQERAIENTIQAFLDIARLVSGIPGEEIANMGDWRISFLLGLGFHSPGGSLSTVYERAMSSMNDAQVAVYPVDVRGLVNYSPAADGTLGPGSAVSSTFTHGAGASSMLGNRSWLNASTLSTLQEFAAMTGGRAFYNRNDLTTGFKRASDDSSSYYLLSYYLDTHNNRPGWRKLQVKVQRNDAEVHSRTGFFATTATVDPSVTHNIDIQYALNSPFESTGIPVTVQWKTTAEVDALRRRLNS